MSRKLFFSAIALSVLLCSSVVVSVKAASMWSRTYGGEEPNLAYSLVEAPDGGYAIASIWNYAGALVKTDALGNIQWYKSYGVTGEDVACSLIATSDGGYALAVENMLVKTDALGNMQWNRTYGGVAYSLVATSDGGYALAGTTNSDFWLVKTDAFGNVQWNTTYGGTGEDVACSLIATSDDGYAIAGVSGCSDDFWYWFGIFLGGGDAWLVKTDALGNMQWNRTYGGAADDWASSLVETSDGGYAIAGTFNFTASFGPGSGDFWLIKTDALGSVEWSRTYGGEGEDLAYSLVKTSDGGYAIAGTWYFSGPGFGSADAWLVKTDSLGNMQWNQTYGSGYNEGDDFARSLVATSDGGYAIAGTWSYSWGWDYTGTHIWGDCWLVKTDEFGVVPEYSSWLVPALVLTATAFIIINKKKLLRRSS